MRTYFRSNNSTPPVIVWSRVRSNTTPASMPRPSGSPSRTTGTRFPAFLPSCTMSASWTSWTTTRNESNAASLLFFLRYWRGMAWGKGVLCFASRLTRLLLFATGCCPTSEGSAVACGSAESHNTQCSLTLFYFLFFMAGLLLHFSRLSPRRTAFSGFYFASWCVL